MTTLADVLREVDHLDDEGLLFAAPPWDADSEAVVLVASGELDPAAPPGLTYMLEVWLIKEVLSVWSQWRSGREPNHREALEAVCFYARNDAYIAVGKAP